MYGVDHCHMLEDRICALDAELARLRASVALADEALRIKEELNEALRQSEDRHRAANARFRALVKAQDAAAVAEARYYRGDASWTDVLMSRDPAIAARRAVDEAGDLRT